MAGFNQGLPPGVAQKIPLHGQLPDLGVQFFDLGLVGRLCALGLAGKGSAMFSMACRFQLAIMLGCNP
jgi:hypothetical protein